MDRPRRNAQYPHSDHVDQPRHSQPCRQDPDNEQRSRKDGDVPGDAASLRIGLGDEVEAGTGIVLSEHPPKCQDMGELPEVSDGEDRPGFQAQAPRRSAPPDEGRHGTGKGACKG